jgi:hypothetical protein
LLEKLQHDYPKLKLKAWSERPPDHRCDITPIAPCNRNDFVFADAVSFPVWRTAIVSVGTFNGGGQVFVVKWGERWHIFVNRRVII